MVFGNRATPPAGQSGACTDDERVRSVDADEQAAAAARIRYRTFGVPLLEPGIELAPFLAAGEGLIAVHRHVLADRREGAPATAGLPGDLYVTTRRLMLLGRRPLSIQLGSITDALVAGGSLLLVAAGGHGIRLSVDQPRLLWVEIVAARSRLGRGQASGDRATAPEDDAQAEAR